MNVPAEYASYPPGRYLIMNTAALPNMYGHCRLDPALFTPPAQHKPRPAVLIEANKRINRFYFNPDELPTLNNVNESPRQQRSERREACTALMGAMIHYTDLETLRIGRPAGLGEFKGLTMEHLARQAGLQLRRAERACRDLVRAGIIKVHRVCEQIADDKFIGLAAIRTLSRNLFEALGLGQRLRDERRKAYARKNKRQPSDQEKGRAGLAMNAIRTQLDHPTTTNKTAAEHCDAMRAALNKPPG